MNKKYVICVTVDAENWSKDSHYGLAIEIDLLHYVNPKVAAQELAHQFSVRLMELLEK